MRLSMMLLEGDLGPLEGIHATPVGGGEAAATTTTSTTTTTSKSTSATTTATTTTAPATAKSTTATALARRTGTGKVEADSTRRASFAKVLAIEGVERRLGLLDRAKAHVAEALQVSRLTMASQVS